MTSRHVFPLELVLICVFPACTHPRCGCRFPYGSFDCQTRRRSLVSPPRASSSHPVVSRSAGECPSHTRPQPPPPLLLLHPGLLHRNLSCSRRWPHPPSSGCTSARPALPSRRPDGKRGALCRGKGGGWIGAFSHAHAQI